MSGENDSKYKKKSTNINNPSDKDLSEIRDIIDQFPLKNNDKISNNKNSYKKDESAKNLDFKKFSPKYLKKNIFYYVSEKNKKLFKKLNIPKETEIVIVELLKKGVPFDSISDQAEYLDNDGGIVNPSISTIRSVEKAHDKEIKLALDGAKKSKFEDNSIIQRRAKMVDKNKKVKASNIHQKDTGSDKVKKRFFFGKKKEDKIKPEKIKEKEHEKAKKRIHFGKKKEDKVKPEKIEKIKKPKEKKPLFFGKTKKETKVKSEIKPIPIKEKEPEKIEKIKKPKDKKPLFFGKTKKEKKKKVKPEIKPIPIKEKEPEKEKKHIHFGKKKEEKTKPEIKPIGLKEKEPEKIEEKEKPRAEKPKLVFGTKKKPKEKSIKEKKTEKKKSKLFGKEKKEEKVKPKLEEISISIEDLNIDIDKLKSDALTKLGYSKKESFEELAFYPLIEPFVYSLIIRDTETLDSIYVLIEMVLSEIETSNFDMIKDTLGKFTINTDEVDEIGRDRYLKDRIDQIMDDYSMEIDIISQKKIAYFLEKNLLGLGKIHPLMKDSNIEDISCDSSDVPIFIYHRNYGSLKSNISFDDEDELSALIVKLAQKCNKHISIANPMLDATMPDGSRIQMTLSTEVTAKGSTFTIRRFKENPFSPSDLIEFNTMSPEMMAYIWLAVQNNTNALIAGGTASGKTSTLNALALFIPPESKIVSIEETREINLPHSNWIPGVARSGFGEVVGDKVTGEIDTYDLMKAALRQRPEYILVGEIRGKEAYVLFQAMATGHTTYSTVHADSTKSLIHRLEGEPINIPRIMLQSLDVVCIQTISRVKDKRARRCKQIIEIIDIDPATKEILTNEVFRWDPIEDKFIYSGKSYVLERIRTDRNQSREEITNELKTRAELLSWMTKKNIKDFKKVASMTANYIDNPGNVMKITREEG